MKKFLVIFCATFFVLGFAGAANAIPYTDLYESGLFMEPLSSVSWTFDIAKDGFIPETQDVTSASVTLNFSDDKDRRHHIEWALLDVGENLFLWEVDSGNIGFTLMSTITLSETGLVEADLYCLIGDFFFNTATLYAEGTDTIPNSAHASEPVSMFMFGSGLIGVAFLGRKKFGKV
jgi:hypothetical protein